MGVGGAVCFDLRYVFVISLLHLLGQLLIYSFCEVNENLLKCPGSHTIAYRCKCHVFSLKWSRIILVPRFWIFYNSVDVLIPIMVFVVRHWNDYAQNSHPSRWESHECEFCRLGGITTHGWFPVQLPAEPFNPDLCRGGKEETGGASVSPCSVSNHASLATKAKELMCKSRELMRLHFYFYFIFICWIKQ